MKRKTSRKTMYLLFLMLLAPFVFISLYTYLYIGFSTRAVFYSTMNRFTENTATGAIDRPVNEIRQMFDSISDYVGEKELNDFLTGDHEGLNAMIPAMVNSTGLFSSVVVFDTNDNYKAYPPLQVKEFKSRSQPWFKANLAREQIYFSKVYNGVTDSADKGVTVSMNLFDNSYNTIGTVAFGMDLDAMSDALRDVILPYNARFKVVDKESGDIVLYKNSNQILDKTISPDWLSRATEVEGEFFDSNERQYVFYRTYRNPTWVAFSVVDENAFNQSMSIAYELYFTIYIFCVVFYIVIFMLAYLYFRQIISKLYMSMNGVETDHGDNLEKIYTEIKQKNKSLNTAVHDAITDGLTGINNRKKFDTDLDFFIKKGKPFVLSIIDIDDFKKINDTFGHDTGDKVLKYVSQTGLSAITNNKGTYLYRFGGEELVVLFTEMTEDESVEVIDTWRKLVALKVWREEGLSVSFSGGIASWCNGDTAAQILKRADSRLYKAKKSGKNRVVAFD